MNSVLILLTSAFPFQRGEEFLMQEANYFSIFEKIYIIPVTARDYSQMKNIPPFIEVIKLRSIPSENLIKKAVSCLKMLLYDDVQSEIKHLIKSKRLCLYALRQLLVDANKVHSVKNEVCHFFESIQAAYPSDQIVIYSYWMGIHAKIATDVKKLFPKIKIVTRCHGGDLYEYRYPSGYIPFRPTIFQNEDIIFPISEDGKKYLLETNPDIRASIVVSRLGINQLHQQAEISNGHGIHLVSCSYCIPLKRIERIIEALSGIDEKGISWTHIGDGCELDRLKQLAMNQIPNHIHYEFLGYVKNQEVQALYATGKYNLFINVSETEGIPVSIMEAMCYGLPVIATDVGGVVEMIDEGVNGYLLPKNFETENLRTTLLAFLHMDAGKFDAMSKKSHEIWEQKFNADKNYTTFMKQLYH